jgi:hypothetical protein
LTQHHNCHFALETAYFSSFLGHFGVLWRFCSIFWEFSAFSDVKMILGVSHFENQEKPAGLTEAGYSACSVRLRLWRRLG